MEVRLVTSTEASLRSEIFTLRAAAYRNYIDDSVHHFNDDFDWHETTWHFAALDGKRLLGAMRISVPPLPCGLHCEEISLLNGNVVEVSRLCIDSGVRNPITRFQVFARLMREAVISCRALNADYAVVCAARASLEEFYRQICGFTYFAVAQPPPPVTVPVKVMVAPVSEMLAKKGTRHAIIQDITNEEIATRLFHLGKKEAA
jgi:predicted GNAT family N-acyltransferase